MSEPIISVSGLRGILGAQLTPLVAARYIAAFASTLRSGKVVVGRDGRGSGQMLAQIVSATLSALGWEAIDVGIAATPTVGLQVKQQGAVGGVQISASHNPKQYNGLKLFSSEGRVLSQGLGEQVLAAYREGNCRWVGVEELGPLTQLADPHTDHAQRVLGTVDEVAIGRKAFRVLLDSNHGAGSLLGRILLERLGCQFTILGDTPDGNFDHPPEPLAENLRSVCAAIRETKSQVGFCQDPDADRLAVIDERGQYIGEELTLALCLLQALPQRTGAVVTNCATSGLAGGIVGQLGGRLLQSAVGEAHVADLMIAEQAVFGGEGNGGPIDPQVGYVRDSFVGMARILDLLAREGDTISSVVARLPPLSMVKDKIELPASDLPRLQEMLVGEFGDAAVSRQDGLKLQWADRWLLVRGSNTEPIVRLIAEAPSHTLAQSLCDRARDLAQGLR
ncbi:MAG: phosphoglucosamine mutase [Planctomycetales bacterium]|nr:phosphoglucosamine mutase [Planctomycetales bacterium]